MDFVYFLIGIVAIIIALSCIGSFALVIYFIYKGMNLKGKDKNDKF